jgi:hypothetical protein
MTTDQPSPPEPPREAGDEALDLDDRELCADGNCTGVVGDDGRCRACGLDARTGERTAAPPPGEAAHGEDGGGYGGEGEDGAESAPGDFEERALCPDGNCVGVIGPDGRCKVCGATAATVEA